MTSAGSPSYCKSQYLQRVPSVFRCRATPTQTSPRVHDDRLLPCNDGDLIQRVLASVRDHGGSRGCYGRRLRDAIGSERGTLFEPLDNADRQILVRCRARPPPSTRPISGSTSTAVPNAWSTRGEGETVDNIL